MRFGTVMVKYWIKKSLEILKQCSSNLAPQKRPNDTHSVVAKETLLGPVSTFSTLLSGTEGPAWNWHGFHMVLTLIVRLVGAYGLWLRQKLGIPVLIRQDQQQNGRYANSTTGVILLFFVMNISRVWNCTQLVASAIENWGGLRMEDQGYYRVLKTFRWRIFPSFKSRKNMINQCTFK